MNRRKTGYRGKVFKDQTSLIGIYPPGKRDLIQKSPETLSVGNRLRRERFLRKLTQEEMADYLNISASYLGAMERGDRPISRRMMNLLHEKLDISYDYMLEGLTITGTTVTKFVKENTIYSAHHNLNVLLNVCDEDELESCYQLVHTFLTHKRDHNPEDEGPCIRK